MAEITYVQLEGTPGILVKDDDRKTLHVYENVDGEWRDPPDNGADMGTKSAVLSKEQFERMFPGIGLPNGVGEAAKERSA